MHSSLKLLIGDVTTGLGARNPECVGIVMPCAAERETGMLTQNQENGDVYSTAWGRQDHNNGINGHMREHTE